MIRLELTSSEAEQLQTGLTRLVSAAEEGDVVVASYQILLEKVTVAYKDAHLQRVCPICQQSFIQEKVGRSGRYCSKACKQRAYRERRNTWRRQTPSHRA